MKKEMMREALKIAKENEKKGGSPYSAIIVKDNQIISTGVNLVDENCDPIAHAEIEAIREASRYLNSTDLQDCVLYASNEPCSMCLSAIYWSNIKEVYYAISASEFSRNIYKEIGKDGDERSIVFEKMDI